MNINAYQIEYHISQKELKEYAAFCYFKYLYRNGCIYNYTSTRLATKSKYSASFIRKMVKVFLAKGWCRMHRDNLIFNKSSQFNGSNAIIKNYEEINIKGLSIKEIIEIFHFQRFKLQESRFEKKKKLKLDLISNKKSIRHKAETYADSIGLKTKAQRLKLPNETDKLQLSNQILKTMFGCSAGKASGIIKGFFKRGLITIYRDIKRQKLQVKVDSYMQEILKGMGASYAYGRYAFIVKPLEFTIN